MVNNPADFQKAKKDARGFAEQAKNEVRSSFSEAADNIKEDFRSSQFGQDLQNKFEHAGEVAREYSEQARNKANEVMDYISREAREKPLKMAGIAFVAGFITAMLRGRRD